jgi:hypothetical protein
MTIRMPEADASQVMQWIGSGVRDSSRGHSPLLSEGSADSSRLQFSGDLATAKKFRDARSSLDRALAKNFGNVSKAFRWLRRDQSAVNESLTDSVRSLLSINRDLSRRLEAVQLRVIDLETQLAEQRPASPPSENSD